MIAKLNTPMKTVSCPECKTRHKIDRNLDEAVRSNVTCDDCVTDLQSHSDRVPLEEPYIMTHSMVDDITDSCFE